MLDGITTSHPQESCVTRNLSPVLQYCVLHLTYHKLYDYCSWLLLRYELNHLQLATEVSFGH